jgi:hypothetical protein
VRLEEVIRAFGESFRKPGRKTVGFQEAQGLNWPVDVSQQFTSHEILPRRTGSQHTSTNDNHGGTSQSWACLD